MSWCGAANRSCSACLVLSSYLLILLALAELVLAIVIFTQGATIDQFLRDHQQELKLTYCACVVDGIAYMHVHTFSHEPCACATTSDDELRKFENNKFLPAYLLIGLFAMEVLRFCCSSELQRARQRHKYHYSSLHTLRDLDDELLAVKKEHVRLVRALVVVGAVWRTDTFGYRRSRPSTRT